MLCHIVSQIVRDISEELTASNIWVMETVSTYKTSVKTYQATQCSISEDHPFSWSSPAEPDLLPTTEMLSMDTHVSVCCLFIFYQSTGFYRIQLQLYSRRGLPNMKQECKPLGCNVWCLIIHVDQFACSKLHTRI
jgi:hypothetical protein